MVSQPECSKVSVRFTPYISELQVLLAAHGVPFGAPGQLVGLADQLSRGSSFTDELSAEIRSIIFREKEGITQSELLEVLTSAAGGDTVDLQDPGLRTAVRQLLSFLNAALRTFWKSSPDGPLRSRLADDAPPVRSSSPGRPAAVEPAFPLPLRVVEEVSLAGEAPQESRNLGALPSPAPARVALQERGTEEVHLAPEPLTRSAGTPRFQDTSVRPALQEPSPTPWRSTEPPEEQIVLAYTEAPVTRLQESEPESEGVFPEYGSLHLIEAARRAPWLLGVLGLLLGCLLGFLLRGKPSHSSTSPETAPLPQVHPGYLPKPSPYSLPQGERAHRAVGPPMDLQPVPATQPISEAPVASARTYAPAVGRLPVRVEGRVTAQAPSARYTPGPTEEALPRERLGAAAGVAPERSSVSAREGIYLSASGIMAANLVAAPAPVYPVAASEAGVQGRVVVQALVGSSGRVLDAHAISGDPMLRNAALSAVRGWRYRPYVVDGRASEIETTATLDFRLFAREP